MATSAADLLDQVNSAITAILGGAQEYTVGLRQVKKADLGKLMQLRSMLQDEITAGGNGGSMCSLGEQVPTR